MSTLSPWALTGACMLVGVAITSLTWHLLGRHGTWYQACALGLLGGVLGSIKGLFMFGDQDDGALFPLALTAGVSLYFGWLGSRR